jgi:hypothetical protein
MASKKIERLYLDSFLKSVGWECCEPDPGESPDFIIHDSIIYSTHRTFGIEVTQIFKDESTKGSSKKAVESHRDKFLKKLTQEYYDQGGHPILVKLWIYTFPDQSDAERLLHRLHESVPPEAWDRAEFCFEAGNNKIAEFFITRLPDSTGRYTRWTCMNNAIGWVRNLDYQLLEQTIQEKSENLEEYRRKVSEVILLIVIDHMNESGMLQWPAQKMCNSHGFKSVYLHIFPLKTYKIA